MTTLLPPIPVALKKALEPYPEKLERLRELLSRAATSTSSSADREEKVLCAIEDFMEAVVFEAMDEFRKVEALGDEVAKASADVKVASLRRASLKTNWAADPGLEEYLRKDRENR